MHKRLIPLIGRLSKLAILAVHGPFASQDTRDYITGSPTPSWATPASSPRSRTGTARRSCSSPSAPSAIPSPSLAKLLANDDFKYLLVVAQIALSVRIAALFFDLTACLTQSKRWAMLATTLYFLSGTPLWDNDILCDSLYASL